MSLSLLDDLSPEFGTEPDNTIHIQQFTATFVYVHMTQAFLVEIRDMIVDRVFRRLKHGIEDVMMNSDTVDGRNPAPPGMYKTF